MSSPQFSVAEVHEAIAATRPDEVCLVHRDRRLTWGQVTDRTFTRDVSTEGAQSSNKAYTNSGYDRGHLAQREAFKGYGDAEIAVDHWTNVVPMTPDLNRGAGSPWAAAERRTVDYVKPVSEGGQGYQSVKVVVEPVYDANPPRLSDGPEHRNMTHQVPRAVRHQRQDRRPAAQRIGRYQQNDSLAQRLLRPSAIPLLEPAAH